MSPHQLVLRCLLIRDGSAWVALCLDFDLAAQSETIEGAKRALDAQIDDYMQAIVAADRELALQLLSRRAPLRYRLQWRWLSLLGHVRSLTTLAQAYISTPSPRALLAA